MTSKALCELLAAQCGFSINWTTRRFPSGGCMYDGKTAWVDTISNAIHEIAHWHVAEPHRRSMANFALGADPWGGGGEEYVDETVDNTWEECEASFLGILAERQLGMDWYKTWCEHNWIDSDISYSAKSTYRRLLDSGVVKPGGYVTFLESCGTPAT